MSTIVKVTGTAWASMASFSGVTASSIVSIDGQLAPASATGITLTDITDTYGRQRFYTTDPIVVTLPSTAAVGDMVLMMFAFDYTGSSDKVATPTNWTIINSGGWGSSTSDAWIYLWWHEITASTGSTVSIYPTVNLSRQAYVAWTTIMSNVNTTNPISIVGSEAISTGTTVTAPAVTAANDGLFICIVAFDGDLGDPFAYSNSSFTLTAGGEQDSNGGGSTGKGLSAGWVYADITSGTSTDDTDITANDSDGKVAGQFVLREA